MGTVGNIQIKPVNVAWGSDVMQVSSITAVADVSSSLNNKYFFIYGLGVKYHVWMNVGGAGVDPAPAGSTAVAVTFAANATAAQVATAVAAAIDGLGEFTAIASSAIVTMTHVTAGYQSAPHEGLGTGFTFLVTTMGDSSVDVGYIDGNVEPALEEQLVDITAHQAGTNVLGQLRTGKSVEITLNFKETTVSQLRKIFTKPGESYVPVGANGTEVFGLGTSRDFTNTFHQATKLVLHPTTLGSGDKSQDVTFWKAYPMIEALPFSGEEIQVVPVTFKVYPDPTKNTKISYMCLGDSTQTLT